MGRRRPNNGGIIEEAKQYILPNVFVKFQKDSKMKPTTK